MSDQKLSVLLSVYNGERYLREAVESILSQTFGDFEFIIINDGSTDATAQILRSYHDPRIVLVENETNIGLTKSLNKGLKLPRGEYIARMDANDVSLPERLRKQVEFLDNHPRVGLVSSWYITMDAVGREMGIVQLPTENAEIQEQLLFFNCICHMSAMFRRECIDTVGHYREDFEMAQDYDLWLRFSERYQMANIAEPLLKVRFSSTGLSTAGRWKQRRFARRAIEQAVRRRMSGEGASRPSNWALARVHLYLACDDFAEGRFDAGRDHMRQAFETDPKLTQETDYVVETLVNWACELWRTSQPENRAQKLKIGEDYIKTVLSNLPPSTGNLAAQYRRALGWFHIGVAFASYQAGVWAEVRRNCLIGLLYDPRWLRNRGVLSIFARSLFKGRESTVASG